MWTSYFPNSGTLIAEPFLDGFVAALVGTGYKPGTIQRYISTFGGARELLARRACAIIGRS
jgi:hypothetical protein